MSDPGQIKSAVGTQDPQVFVDSLVGALSPIYDKESKESLHYKLYELLAKELVKADILLEQVQNNNYLTVDVPNEIIVRGNSNLDRLKNENAFELDQIRVNSPNYLTTQNVQLVKGINIVQLYFIPQNISSIFVTKVGDATKASVQFPVVIDSTTNKLTILADFSGTFTINYIDTGDVLRTSKNITIPEGLFYLGWDEGPYDQLGWDE